MTAQTVREIAGSSFTDAIEMLGLVAVLEAGNQRPLAPRPRSASDNTSRLSSGLGYWVAGVL